MREKANGLRHISWKRLGGCHRTIQAAVDAAHADDVVTGTAGAYFESVVVQGLWRARVRIIGADRARTIATGSAFGTTGACLF